MTPLAKQRSVPCGRLRERMLKINFSGAIKHSFRRCTTCSSARSSAAAGLALAGIIALALGGCGSPSPSATAACVNADQARLCVRWSQEDRTKYVVIADNLAPNTQATLVSEHGGGSTLRYMTSASGQLGATHSSSGIVVPKGQTVDERLTATSKGGHVVSALFGMVGGLPPHALGSK